MINYMKIAIECANDSDNDIPVGAVIVKDGLVIAKACNQREKNKDVSAHAEILAIREAEKVLNNWRLSECDMYVTLEPCPMCGWAILQARIRNLYFGSYDNSYGCFTSKVDLRQISTGKISVYGGICEIECDDLLNKYFSQIRNRTVI